ncbi:ABC transporter permease [Solihabitans fulvus]|uniref:ABC transporter permease n=1 Tax=Solihabitans fulvus TaxID=1892852 RepID=A0A5B2WYQ2_9PSEU|nr:ABC transporter permease [Solihabitans fulvus]KAA2256148.1 ABC transporter permease [Solihabitans fulvus]
MLRTDRWALGGVVAIVLLGVVAAAANLLTAIEGQDPFTYHNEALDHATGRPAGTLGGVSGAHWFGVEPLTGRDVFAIVAFGARTSFLIGLAATLVSVVLGVLLGASAGYLGGWYDRAVVWTADVFLGFPYLVFMIALGAVVPASVPRPLLLVVVIGFFGWPSIARIVRSQTLTLKKRNFVSAARALGAGPWHVFRVELLPNLWAPIIIVATLSIPGKIGLEAALSFLGVGMPPPTPSWGRSISGAIDWVRTDPMLLIFPGLALFLATWGFNVFGDGLRDALDPRTEVRR